MNETTALLWALGQITIVVLAVWLVVRRLFPRRVQKPLTRATHLANGIAMLVAAFAWAALGLLVCFNAAWAGATAGFFLIVLAVGGGIFLLIVWEAVRHFRQASDRSNHGPPQE